MKRETTKPAPDSEWHPDLLLSALKKHPRLTAITSATGVVIRIPSSFGSLLYGAFFAAGPIFALAAILLNWDDIANDTSRRGIRIASLIIGLPLIIAWPWWWFFGGEQIELTPTSLNYTAGLRRFKHYRTFAWPLVENIRLTTPRPYGLGYQILFGYASDLGMVHGIGRHLSKDEANELIPILRAHQSSVLKK